MAIYVFLIASILSALLVAGEKKKLGGLILAIAFVAMWLVAGLRAVSVGTDTNSYYEFFNFILEGNFSVGDVLNPLHIFDVSGGFEKGFTIYTYLVSRITGDFTTYLLITYGIIYFSFYKFIKKYSTNYLVSFSIFVSLFFFDSMNIMRQFIALAILTWGFRYILERKLLKYLFVVSLAVLFHQASIVMILPYILYGRRFTRLSFFAYIIMAVASLPLVTPIVQILAEGNVRYGTYLDKLSVLKLGSFLLVGFYLAVLVLSIYLARKRKQTTQDGMFTPADTDKLTDLFLHTAALTVSVGIISILMTGFNRFIEYFALFNLVSLPFVFHGAKIRSKRSVELVFVGAVLVYAFVILMVRPEWLSVWPYSFGAL